MLWKLRFNALLIASKSTDSRVGSLTAEGVALGVPSGLS